MAKSDKDLQDIVGDAMGNDLLGTPVKKVSKKTPYSHPYPRGGSTYGGRQSYLWEDDDQFGDEFEDDLRQSPFGGRRTTSEDLPEIEGDKALFKARHYTALKKSLEHAVGDALDKNKLSLSYERMQRVLSDLNDGVIEEVTDGGLKYNHRGMVYTVVTDFYDDE